jgi:bifunctional non-homologous end joining protein LigD
LSERAAQRGEARPGATERKHLRRRAVARIGSGAVIKPKRHPSAAALLRATWPPMKAILATPADVSSETHLLEVKYDGYRALIGVTDGAALILSRNGLDRTDDFPEVAAAAARLDVEGAVLDGEIVAAHGDVVYGMQGFQDGTRHARMMVFDLLWLDGDDLRGRPLEERRQALERVVGSATQRRGGRALQLAARVGLAPAEALDEARRSGQEGVIAKRRGSLYVGGPGRDWLKLKVVHTQDVVLIGFTPLRRAGADPDAAVHEVGALVIAVRDGNRYRYAGKVGTGMTTKLRRELWRLLSAAHAPEPPAADSPRLRDVRWVAPRYAAEVGFSEWTRDGRLRHPTFRGLRPDKKPEECVREIAAGAPPV